LAKGESELECRELYNLSDDPRESINLHDIFPEKVEPLCDRLQSFLGELPTTGFAEETADNFNDPEVYRRLRDLGYID